MKKRHLIRLWILAVILFTGAGIGLPYLTPEPENAGIAQDDGEEEVEETPLVILNEDNIKQATVYIMQAYDTDDGPVISCVGSGTLVSANGLILTNYHVASDQYDCRSDRVIIALTLRIDEPPVPTYLAEIIEEDNGLDIAVLQITSYLDGRQIDPATLQLPFVELGDSDQLQLDDTIRVFGYPGVQNDPVALVRGTVSGFTAEARAGNRAWIRTTSDIPGLMSGGGAYNSNGELIGIPTITPARIAGTPVDCRAIYDTNYDNQIDREDECIAVGGNISAIRPSALARGLVRAATLGIQPGPQRSSTTLEPPTGPPIISRAFVATGITPEGMPISVVQSVPQGTGSLYLFFDYANMVNGLVYELRTTIDGRPSLLYSLPPVTWSGGQRGMWYIGSSGVPYPNGVYEFTLYVEGRQLQSHSVVIGGGPQQVPQFSDIVFGIESAEGTLVGANYVIPEGNIIRARFNYRNMREGLIWQQRWYVGVDASPFNVVENLIWDRGESGTNEDQASIQSETGFPSGSYRLELWVQHSEDSDPVLSATANFIVAGGAGGVNDAQALIFEDFRFAGGQENNLPVNGSDGTFSTNPAAIYVFFNWRQISPGTPFAWRWLVDSEVLFEQYTEWPVEASGLNYFLSLVGSPTLPDATYTFQIEMGGIPLESVEARVGLGQLPLDTFADAEGIQLVGYVRDAETDQGIPGAMFIVLLSEFSIEDFTWRDSQVLSRAVTDRNGYFQIPELLPRGTLEEPILYSMLVRAEGYFPINTDGVIVTGERSPLEMNVELNRN